MTASSKKKKEKKKDFVKPKLKVGKAKPKPSNFTDTSFKSKAIVLATQSIQQAAPTASHLLNHNLSLLTHHSSTTRKEALSYLTSHLPPTLETPGTQSIPTATLIPALAPIILDQSTSVRAQLLSLFQGLPNKQIELYIPKIMLYVNSAMTHISPEIRIDSTKFLGWLLSVNGDSVLRNGGWTKCIWGLLGVLGFDSGRDIKSQVILKGGAANGGPAGGAKTKTMLQHLSVLHDFLVAGLLDSKDRTERMEIGPNRPIWTSGTPHWTTHLHMIPSNPNQSNTFAYLNLFSTTVMHDATGSVEVGAIEDKKARRRWLMEGSGMEALGALRRGLEGVRKEGGELGRMGGRALGIMDEARSSKHDE